MAVLQLGAIFLLNLLTSRAIAAISYEGYKVYEVVPENLEQLRFLHEFSENPKYDFWKSSRNVGTVSHVMVPPEEQGYFELLLTHNGFVSFKISVPNVESVILQEKLERSMARSLNTGQVTFNSFMTYEEHVAYVRRIAQDYPEITTMETIGQSHEGRDIPLLYISSGPNETSVPKPLIILDAGIHCREWIAPTVTLYIINQLVENSTNAALLQNVDWAIVPNLNPDGYEYTQRNNRLWRKNRQTATGSSCIGTDLNRNFGYMWMFDGASDDPCSDTHAGTAAFSEPETSALRNWILAHNENARLYLAFHSYGKMILFPWGYAPIYTDNAEELKHLGTLAANAIAASSTIGSAYEVENSAIFLYAAAGAADDWAMGEAGIELSYTVELPAGDAPHSFMIPARQILPVVQETFEGIRIFHQYIEEKFWTNATEVD
ncbi:carboxypeptidase B-like [Euwallacea fornicatus]|uniref:carboxypeptidase B-like n=1 Tax=Euwallacea fornicatus TaxID=995702 RepID=UPI00338E69AE